MLTCNRENLNFVESLTQEELRSMEVLRWFYKQKDYINAIYYTNELARKFLLKGEIKAA